jgi:putative transposase
VELVFDPFDLTILTVRCGGKDAGTATPHHITRHSHPKARPEDPGSGDDAPRATGVDYIALIGEQHDRQKQGPVNYRALMPPAGPPASGQDSQEQDGRKTGGEDGRG